eukprot:scaffold11209_cov104-Skeletonema_dohrnii-CCMP3373.AAC.1
MLRQTTQLGRHFADASWSRIFPINNRATQTTICGFSVLYRYSSCDGESQEYSLLHLSSVCDPLRSQRGEEVRRLIRGRHNTMYDCLNEALNGRILPCISWD